GNSSGDFPPPEDVDWSLSHAEPSDLGDGAEGPAAGKPGSCPRDFTRCLRPEPPLCANDSGCPGWQKCCHRECRLRCTPPAEGTPVLCLAGGVGACPVPRDRGTCLDLCSFDEECPWGQKCCSNGCGHVCTPAGARPLRLPAAPWPWRELPVPPRRSPRDP
uniref:WAP domain-containing protein n=1 Tax=Dromaius novaehollandiae TaxID=8790 RepID=A0A8C4JHS2_DRONO